MISHRLFTFACVVCLLGCGDDEPEASSRSTEASSSSAGAGANGGTGGAGTGGLPAGGAGGSGASVEPIDAPPDEWAWRPIEGTKCGNGSMAGVAVNLHPDSTDFFLVVSGGGACWDDEMCNGAMPASIHLHEDLTEALIAPELPSVDRSDPNNPLSTASWVYVPYCTGDVHWGDRTATYDSGPIEHRGASNMRTFLERLQATRPASTRVLLFGGSAGGYGVTLHGGTAKEVFGDAVEVHSLADASPLVMPLGGRWDAMKAAWDPQFPTGCSDCAADMGNIVDALAGAYPDSRHGMMVYDADSVIAAYFGYTNELPAAVDAMVAAHYDAFDNTKYFVATGTDHGVFTDAIAAPDGTTPITFALGCLFGDPSWHSVNF